MKQYVRRSRSRDKRARSEGEKNHIKETEIIEHIRYDELNATQEHGNKT